MMPSLNDKWRGLKVAVSIEEVALVLVRTPTLGDQAQKITWQPITDSGLKEDTPKQEIMDQVTIL